MDTDEFIAATMRRVADAAVPAQHRAAAPAPARRWFAPLVVAAAAAVVALIIVAAGWMRSESPEGGPAADVTTRSSPESGAACRLDYTSTPLPQWARAGFTPPDQPVPQVLGDRGD